MRVDKGFGIYYGRILTETLPAQLVPAMFGFFAYKAAAVVQVYRDNVDLVMVFPDKEDESINT